MVVDAIIYTTLLNTERKGVFLNGISWSASSHLTLLAAWC